MRRNLLVVLALLSALVAAAALPAVAQELPPWEVTLDISFPTRADATFSDTYDACRSGCSRSHQATDVIGGKHWPLYAVTDGTVCRLDEGEEDAYGRHLTLCGDDGNQYRYLHMNNDTPGTDDGQAGLEHVYAPGILQGVRVARGQLVGWMGDSGNAEESVDHLHFDIFVPGVVNPWGEERVNPYRSLRAAADRGDFPDGTALATERHDRVGGVDRVETAVLLSRATFAAADHVVLAGARAPQDALVAGPLAATLGAPVLITDDVVDERVLAEVTRLGATAATVVGAVPGDLTPLRHLLGDEAVTRIDGGNPFATSAAVAEAVFAATGAADDVVTTLQGEPVTFDLEDLATVADQEPTLAVSHDHDHGEPHDLDGATVPGDLDEVFVRLAGVDPTDVWRVGFFVDDPTLEGSPVHVERSWPWDLRDGPGGGFAVGRLDPGEHTLTAAVQYDDHSIETHTATFTIAEPAMGREALLALGEAEVASRSWPDALMGSWYGAVRGVPVVLTRPDAVPFEVSALVDSLTGAVVAGGPAAVSEAQFDEIRALVDGEVRRLAGEDRYGTAVAIAEDLRRRGDVAAELVHVATGRNWPDAVTAGPAVARTGQLLLLVDGDAGRSREVAYALRGMADEVRDVRALGGPAAITDDVLRVVASWAL